MSEVVGNEVTPIQRKRGGATGSRDMRAIQVRKEVKDVLSRSNLTIERQTTGSKNEAEGPNATFQVSGKGVDTPFNRYYLNKKLDRLNEKFGITAHLRRKERGVEHVIVDVYLKPHVNEKS